MSGVEICLLSHPAVKDRDFRASVLRDHRDIAASGPYGAYTDKANCQWKPSLEEVSCTLRMGLSQRRHKPQYLESIPS